MGPLIELKNISKTYSDGDVQTPALCGVSFSVDKGEFVAIMGASGSGKSTLLHILGFLDRQTDGEYFFNGKKLDDHSSEELAHVRNGDMGFVFQSFNLLPRTTVLENVKLPLYYSHVKSSHWENMAIKAIDMVGLSHRAHHLTSQLSGGEQQRAAIARALVNSPKVIFADEPTGNLDSKSGGQIMEFLEQLNDMGHTIVLITHETYTAGYSKRIIRLKDGEIESDKLVEERHRHKGKEEFIK